MIIFKTARIKFFYSLVLLVILFSCADKAKIITINETISAKAELIYENDFNNLDDWQVEQMEGGKVEIKNSKLEITDAKGCTTWLKKPFEGPIMIEYDVFVIDEDGPHDRVSDLNCFWMATDPENPGNLFVNSKKRKGRFPNYDSLKLYYTGVGGHYNKKTRFRRYTGNGEKPLLPEHDLSDSKFLLKANTPYQIRIIAFDNHIQYYRDGELFFNFIDPNPYTSGHFGFRTVNNHMTVDNFKVYKLLK